MELLGKDNKLLYGGLSRYSCHLSAIKTRCALHKTGNVICVLTESQLVYI